MTTSTSYPLLGEVPSSEGVLDRRALDQLAKRRLKELGRFHRLGLISNDVFRPCICLARSKTESAACWLTCSNSRTAAARAFS